MKAVELQLRALDRGIAIAPGPIFSARQRFTTCVGIADVGRMAHEIRDRSG